MSEALVTDEIVKKAAEAFSVSAGKVNQVVWFKDMCAALTAVVGDLVRAEREACTKLALDAVQFPQPRPVGLDVADAIRARG